jgi:hypothetical protein
MVWMIGFLLFYITLNYTFTYSVSLQHLSLCFGYRKLFLYSEARGNGTGRDAYWSLSNDRQGTACRPLPGPFLRGRGLLLLIVFFFFFFKKKKSFFLKTHPPSSIPIFLPQTIFPPNLSLPLSLSPSPLLNPTVSPPQSTTHEPATVDHSRARHSTVRSPSPAKTEPPCVLQLRFGSDNSTTDRHEQPQPKHQRRSRRRAHPL